MVLLMLKCCDRIFRSQQTSCKELPDGAMVVVACKSHEHTSSKLTDTEATRRVKPRVASAVEMETERRVYNFVIRLLGLRNELILDGVMYH